METIVTIGFRTHAILFEIISIGRYEPPIVCVLDVREKPVVVIFIEGCDIQVKMTSVGHPGPAPREEPAALRKRGLEL
jgi:hypothetical protein